jgi:uncharacterized protein YqgC (DUF456 family)
MWLFTAVALMLPGIVGVFIPVLPGIPLMFLVALLFGLVNKFQALTANELVILFCIALVSIAIDYLAGVLGAKYSGASSKALVAGFVGMIGGLFIFGPLGALLGLFAGVLLVELRASRPHTEALRAATGSLIGTVAGMLVNFVLALIFVGVFIAFAWR